MDGCISKMTSEQTTGMSFLPELRLVLGAGEEGLEGV